MKNLQAIQFNDRDVLSRLLDLGDGELDMLAFGVIEMDLHCNVLRYNATESRYSGLPPDRVLGRHFFREVAPCANNRHVAERYALDNLDETIGYTFSLRMKPVPVTLRMLKSVGHQRMYLIVTWD